MKRRIPKDHELYRVVFSDGREEVTHGFNPLDAAKRAKRGRKVRVLRSTRA